MKKKLSLFALTALFSMGLAVYANHQKDMNVLLDSNVEALSDNNEPSGGNSYMEFGSAPNRVLVDNVTHVVVFESMRPTYDSQGKPLNGCVSEAGSICTVSTATTVYNIGEIMDHVANVIKALVPLLQLLFA